MPLGLNRNGDFRNGSPMTLPHEFGNVVNWTPDSAHFGNPVTLPKDFGNPVTWPAPDPTHFGNIISGGNPPPVGLQSTQTSILAATFGNSGMFPVTIIPSVGPGNRINLIGIVIQPTGGADAGWGTLARVSIGPLPSLGVTGEFSIADEAGFAYEYVSLFTNTAAENDGTTPLPVSYFDNQPYCLALQQFTQTGTSDYRVTTYYTIEPIF